ncbi:MAG: hypothetical protein ABH983_06040 [Candidatus Micrarchaeota archaeon]|nr:hypothetical protein [Candidatus Micrarchaeota archaeon]MBU1682016.1 hypothetical protein [Candidatus Micrarchaeota archaeon]
MRGQISLEFLLMFSISLVLFSTLASVLIVEQEKLQDAHADLQKITAVKQASFAASLWLNNGRIYPLDFSSENIFFRIENDRFLVVYNMEVIEIEGVFDYEKSEPL